MGIFDRLEMKRQYKKHEESERKSAYNKVYQQELEKARAKQMQERARISAQRQAQKEMGGGGIMGILQTRKYVQPPMTTKQKQNLMTFEQHQRMKAEKQRISSRYAPRKVGAPLKLGPLGDILNNMGRAANQEFGGNQQMQNLNKLTQPKQNQGFNPLLEGGGGFGLAALEEEGIIPKQKKK